MRRAVLIFSCALSGVSILLTSVLIHFAVYRGFSERIRLDAAARARLVAAAAGLAPRRDAAYFKELTERASPPDDMRLTLIAPGGTVVFDSGGREDEMENHAGRPEVMEAYERGTGESSRYSETIGKRTYYYAVRLDGGYILRAAVTSDSVFSSLSRIFPLTMLIAAAVFALAALAGRRVAGKILAPVNSIDIENPRENAAYEELSPLLGRIRAQNDRIASQLAELRAKQLEFSAITEHMREGLVVLDLGAKIIYVNGGALSLLRLPHGDYTGGGVRSLSRDAAFLSAAERALGGEPSEIVIASGDSSVQLMANPVSDGGEQPGGGKISGAVLVLLDVTERYERERLRREFSANVSHELKTPLTVISGYAELLSNGVAKPEDAPRFAASIYTEARRLIALVEDIIMLSRLDEGGASETRERADLRALARDAAETLAEKAAERGITVETAGESVEITGIPHVIREIVFNLVDNAVKYNRDGGRVLVSVKKTRSAAVLAVEDTGIGIPPGEHERVFERFYRVDKSRGGSVAGTGLGLSIVKHGAMLHGAKIDMRSDGETGTVVTVSFPLSA
ncbi:MAG: PAS domain-containing protein [Oscillospiraceae bacterium]|jgi:two-component system phosphate regulon sensor histidine kinase PhoR|nr:PAS domain-containing protein [Oscillospiraceae bacterium]